MHERGHNAAVQKQYSERQKKMPGKNFGLKTVLKSQIHNGDITR